MAGQPSFSVANLHPADRILLSASLLLVIDSFLPWQRGLGLSLNAWSGSGKWAGVLMGLFTILVVLWSAASAAGMTSEIGDTGGKVGAVLVGGTFGFGLLKFVFSAFHYGTFFAWTGLLFLLAVAYGGYMRLQEPSEAQGAPPRGSTKPPSPPSPPGHGGFLP